MRITEGRAVIDTGQGFYNPNAKLARDLGVLAAAVLREEGKRPIDVADLFAGTGIRGIRYALEVGTGRLLINEGNKNLLPVIEKNLESNRVMASTTSTEVIRLLSKIKAEDCQFDLLDLDVFGSPAPFLDGVFGAVKFRGLVYITSTDTRTACGRHPRASIRNYGTYLPRCDFCHELGARAILANLCLAGGKKGFMTRPLFTLWDGHALRICIRITKGRAEFPVENLGYLIIDHGKAVHKLSMGDTIPQGARGQIIGPVWTGPIQDKAFLERMRAHAESTGTQQALSKLESLREEMDYPAWFFRTDTASRAAACGTPAVEAVISSLIDQGFTGSKTHFSPLGIRTNASYKDFVRTVRQVSQG